MRQRTAEQPWHDLGLVQVAMALAVEVHTEDLRKGTTIPYVSHLWAVAALVLEHGGDDVQVAAALLHDAVEDGGGLVMLERIRSINVEVAELVEHLSDSVVDTTSGQEKPPWRDRKVGYLRSLEQADDRVLLVSACDKLHNARCILADHRALGKELWTRFSTAEPSCHAWYYDSLALAFDGRVPPALHDELRRTVDELIARMRACESPDVDRLVAEQRATQASPTAG